MELKSIIKELQLPVEIFSLRDFPDYEAPEETGKTFSENAAIKAIYAAKKSNMWALADDSGVVVPALDGRPGINSSCYAGENASARENCQKLLKDMSNLRRDERRAYSESSLALASPDGLKKSVNGSCEGEIVPKERGCNGFVYDSIFAKDGYGKTFAELELNIKNKISHRRKAFDKMVIFIESLLSAPNK